MPASKWSVASSRGWLLKLLACCLFAVSCKSIEPSADGNYPPAVIPKPDQAPATPTSPAWTPIRIGDTLELFVAEDPTFNGIYMVRERGDILLAGAGRIQVAGMTVVEAEARIRSKLEASQLKSATVTLDRVGRAREDASKLADSDSDKLGVIRIFMTGRVAKPGQHRIPVPDSGILGVYDALLIAGGPISFADLPKVHLLRRDEAGRRHKIPVDVEKIERGEIPDPPIGDGDVLVVPEKVFGF